MQLVLLLWLVGLPLHALLYLLFDRGQLIVLYAVQLFDVGEGQGEFLQVLPLLLVELVLLEKLLFEVVSLKWLVAVNLQVILIFLNILLERVQLGVVARRLVLVQLLRGHLRKVVPAPLPVLLILVLHQDLVEVLRRLEECDLIVLFEDHWRHHLLLGELVVFVEGRRVGLDLELMRVFQGTLVRVLEIDHYRNGKLTVPGVVYLEGRLLDGDKGLRVAVMDGKLDFLDQEGQVLLLHRVIGLARLPQAPDVAAPFV